MRHIPTRAAADFEFSITETEMSYEVQIRRATDKGYSRWERFDGTHDWDEAKTMYHRAERTRPDHQARIVQTTTTHQHAVLRHF